MPGGQTNTHVDAKAHPVTVLVLALVVALFVVGGLLGAVAYGVFCLARFAVGRAARAMAGGGAGGRVRHPFKDRRTASSLVR
ncbi:MAG: hypothetical protein ACRDTP_06085 [Mycobacteriales bacterium]